MDGRKRVRLALNWLNGSTLLGLATAVISRCDVRPGPEGLIFAHGYRPPIPQASAFTLGNVILFRAGPEAVALRPKLVKHESRHSTQYAVCLGLPFLPTYFAAAGVSWLLTGDPASRNPFERGAGLADGGYVERPLRRRIQRSRLLHRRA